VLFVVIAYVLGSTRGKEMGERRRERKAAKQAGKEKREPLSQRYLSRGSARIAFLVGAALTLPGFSYLVALHRLDEQGLAVAATVLAIVAFNLIMLLLLEVPLIGYAFAPDRTAAAVESFKDWLTRRGREFATYATAVIGGLLILRGVIELL